MRSKVTKIVLFHENSPTEQNIRTTDAIIRAILTEAGLSLEFQNEAVEHGAYIRKCTNIEPDSNGINKSLTEEFTGTLLDIKMCKT
jgi:hypothetical protein